MSFQPFQFLYFIFVIVISLLLWKIKNNTVRIVIILITISVLFFSPFYFKQEGGVAIERSVNQFSTIVIPEKVIVNEKSFEERQKEELSNLKSISKGIMENENKNGN